MTNVLPRRLQDLFKMSSRHLAKMSSGHLQKTFSRQTAKTIIYRKISLAYMSEIDGHGINLTGVNSLDTTKLVEKLFLKYFMK